MKHRIVILGAGYAGVYVAGNLARRLSPADTVITVVNAVPDFVERLRLHQLASGQEIETHMLADVFAGTGIRLRLAHATAVDPERQVVAVADAAGESGYDTLVYALGSHGAERGVPGAAEHAFDVAARPAALRLRERLDSLDSLDRWTELARSRGRGQLLCCCQRCIWASRRRAGSLSSVVAIPAAAA